MIIFNTDFTIIVKEFINPISIVKKKIFIVLICQLIFSCNKENSPDAPLLDGVTCNIGDGKNTYNCTMIKNQISREFIIYVPDSYTQSSSVPLLFSLHGFGSRAEWNIQYTGFQSLSDLNGFIIIYPQGTLWKTVPSDKNGYSSEGDTHWNVGWETNLGERSSADDISFIEDLIDWSANNYGIDTNRVYSTGMSNGGFMSYNLACNLSSKIAAIASVTGSMSPVNFNNCDPNHPMPILQIHGLQDYVVPYLGYEGLCKPIEDVINYWVDFNSCNKTSTDETISDLDGDEYGGIYKTYDNGRNNVSVKLYLLDRMSHDWPRINGPEDYEIYDIDAPTIIWEFLSKYNINGLIN